jgi:hypothetical protein
LLLVLASGCDGPGPLRTGEVRWRWTHGDILEAKDVDDGVWINLACPSEHGIGVQAEFTVLTREVREFERRDPLLRRRDPLQLVAWRRCSDAALVQPAPDPAQPVR